MPWYRQFWPWFLIALPGAAVIGGMATLVIAVADPDGLVVSDYYREGLAINQSFARQRAAEQLGLTGELALDADTGMAHLRLTNSARLDEVSLRLVHPTRAYKDLQASLYRDLSGRLSGPIGRPGEGRWRVVVEPPDKAWRLTGAVEWPGAAFIRLSPG
jgi:hypothetical protein